MADELPSPELHPVHSAPPRPRFRWVRRLATFLGFLILLAAAMIAMLDTGPGRRLMVDRIAALSPYSGLKIRIGRIDGSIWNRATVRDLRLYDAQGLFLEAPEVELAWRPASWIANKLDIDRIASDLVILHRIPKLRPPLKKSPILPGFDIHIGRFEIEHLRVAKGVAGAAHVVKAEGRADIRRGRALVQLTARSNADDRLALTLDAEPDRDRFDLDLVVDGPASGLLAKAFGGRLVSARIKGDGRWSSWQGQGGLRVADQQVADLALTARDGQFGLSGIIAPASLLKGRLQRLSDGGVSVKGAATLVDRQLAGSLTLASSSIDLALKGALDLAESRFDHMKIVARLLRPPALFLNMKGRNIQLAGELNGAFALPDFEYRLTADHVAFDQTGFDGVRAEGKGRITPSPVRLPIRLSARRVTGAGDIAGGILANLVIAGDLRITSRQILGQGLSLTSDRLRGKVDVRLDINTGLYDVGLSGALARYLIPGLGLVDVQTELKVVPGSQGRGTEVAGRGRVWVRRFDNSFLRSLAGGLPVIEARLRRGPDRILRFDNLVLTAPAIRITGSGMRRTNGTFQFKGQGVQSRYGPLVMALDGRIERPKIDLLLSQPMAALGLSNVHIQLDPQSTGFAYQAEGGSTLGPFTSNGQVLLPPKLPATIAVAAFTVSGARGIGALRSDPGGFTGGLQFSEGIVSGPMQFSMIDGVQKIEAQLVARDATFDGPVPITLARGRLDGTIMMVPDRPTIEAKLTLEGARRGTITIARGNGQLQMRGGEGVLALNIAGTQRRAFQLNSSTRISPDRLEISGTGNLDRRPLVLAGAAVLTRDGDAWRLAPTTLEFAGGRANFAGRFGGAVNELHARVSRLPLSLLDIVYPQLGLGGKASGEVDYRRQKGNRIPTGRANLKISGLTRSGLVLSSRPIDVALTAVLNENSAAARAVMAADGKVLGRAQGQLTNMPSVNLLADRIAAASVMAQLRYDGPADVLWRLSGVETIDLTGPLAIGADVSGPIMNPVIRGSLRTKQARLESALTGTVISGIDAAGHFDGSQLHVDRFTGKTRGDGSITGKASFDFAGGRGFSMDVSAEARNAQLLSRDDIAATVSGPLALKSDGTGGVISGDLVLNKSRFQLGKTSAASLARLKVVELNRPLDADIGLRTAIPWRLAIKARAPNQMSITGLGLSSEWRSALVISGTIENPSILGRADLVRGDYEFAGRRFDLDRGVIRFAGQVPPDPSLDIVAKATINGINTAITVSGTGLRPTISFTSTPALPEDELLSRLLFGTSIAKLSAPEALQLAAAVASLRSDSVGLNPINAVRKAVGLDRLRILPADVTTGQGTSVAAGKYIGRRTFIELVSDGQGYSATRLEFQVTRWLSLLATISTIGRQSASVKVSRDY